MSNSVVERAEEARSIIASMRIKQPAVPRPPGPSGLSTTWSLISGRKQAYELFSGMAQWHQPIVHVRLMRDHVNVLFSPEAIWDVFVTNGRYTRKSLALQMTRAVLGDGLLTADGDTHKRHRRIIQPLFHHERVDGYVDDMVEAAQITAGTFQDGAVIELTDCMSELTLDVIGRTIFGLDLRGEAPQFAASLEMVLQGFSRGRLGMSGPLSRIPSARTRQEMEAVEDLDNIVNAMIRQRQQAISEGFAGNDLLTLLLTTTDADGQPAFSLQDVRDEAMTLVLAGHETTALLLTWTWHLLSHNPEQRQWLLEELDALPDRPLTAADLPGMHRTFAVLAESLRLYPPAWIVGRWLEKDMRVAGWDLPKGSTVLASQYAMNRDARYWANPTSFHPQRWITAEGKYDERAPEVPRGVWFPFGFASRRCIGEGFAWTEAATLLGTLARGWDLQVQSPADPALMSAVTLRPAEPMPTIVRAR